MLCYVTLYHVTLNMLLHIGQWQTQEPAPRGLLLHWRGAVLAPLAYGQFSSCSDACQHFHLTIIPPYYPSLLHSSYYPSLHINIPTPTPATEPLV